MSTPARPMTSEKWRNLHEHQRNLFQARPPDANACDRLEHFKNAVHNAALSIFGKKTKKTADCFEAHSEGMTSVIEEKRTAQAAYKACPSDCNLRGSSEPLVAKSSRPPKKQFTPSSACLEPACVGGARQRTNP